MRRVAAAAVFAAAALGASPALAAGPLSFAAPVKIDPSFGLGGVSCPAMSLCVAGDSGGNVVTSTNPTGGASAWTLTNLPAPGPYPPPEPGGTSPAINGVSCASPSLCAAIDEISTILTSSNPTGGASAWSFAPVGEFIFGRFSGISCPSSSLCVATVPSARDLGAVIESSTNPTGGASTWNRAIFLPFIPTGVSCSSASLCVAIDNSGNVVPATNPTGDSRAWVPVKVDGSNTLSAISCVTGMCVAVDQVGNLVSSTNPTGGAGAWSVAGVDAGHVLTGVSCASASLCVAVDDAGNALVSSNPTGGAGAWSSTGIDPGQALTAISCPSVSVCVAVDGAGNAVVGTGAAPHVVSVNPADGSTGVPRSTRPFAVFSEPMDETATAGAFSLLDDTTGRPVAGTVVWFGDHVPVFVPRRGHLHRRHRYTAIISTAARAANGTSLAAPVNWSFTVAAHGRG